MTKLETWMHIALVLRVYRVRFSDDPQVLLIEVLVVFFTY
jgi:hypothetical protein